MNEDTEPVEGVSLAEKMAYVTQQKLVHRAKLALKLKRVDDQLAGLIGWEREDRRTIDPLLDMRNEITFEIERLDLLP